MRDKDIQLITDICYMYYKLDLPQSKIASRTGFTRQTVSRILQKAKNDGIVRIHINSPMHELTELKIKIEEKYDLKDVFILENKSINKETKTIDFDYLLGEYFSKILTSGMNIGLGTGKSIKAMIDSIQGNPIKEKLNNINIIQLMGGTNALDSYKNPQFLVSEAASRINANPVFLNAPLIMDDEASKEVVLSQHIVQKTYESFKKLDVAIVEINDAQKPYIPYERNEDKSVVFLNTLGINYLDNKNYAGEICLNYFNDKGHFLDSELSDRTVAIGYKDLRRTKNLVAIAVGERLISSTKSCLETGIIDTLFIDEQIATEIINS